VLDTHDASTVVTLPVTVTNSYHSGAECAAAIAGVLEAATAAQAMGNTEAVLAYVLIAMSELTAGLDSSTPVAHATEVEMREQATALVLSMAESADVDVSGVDVALLAVVSNPAPLSQTAQAAIADFLVDRTANVRALAASGSVTYDDLGNIFGIIGQVMGAPNVATTSPAARKLLTTQATYMSLDQSLSVVSVAALTMLHEGDTSYTPSSPVSSFTCSCCLARTPTTARAWTTSPSPRGRSTWTKAGCACRSTTRRWCTS
jgi:hypothetical protein